MISVVDLWRSVQGTAKKSTTGYQTEVKFNDDLVLVELTVLKALCEQYEKEQVVSDDLSFFVETLDNLPDDKPSDYFRFISAEINGDEVYPVHRNSVSMTKNSPIRGEEKSFYFDGNKIKYLLGGDDSVVSGLFSYIRKPLPGVVGMEYSDEGGDYQTPVSVRDLDWPDSVRNLIEALMLERLGVETREVIAMEFARLGIQREMSNYQ